MQSFESLEELALFDYSQMRALDDKRATDEALLTFHQLLTNFFQQFPTNAQPTLQTLQRYVTQMHRIIAAINPAEYQFFHSKYQGEDIDMPQETIQQMAYFASRITSIQRIPDRMQFWASGVDKGDTIRYPRQHRKLVGLLNKWSDLAVEQGLELTTPNL